MPLLNVDERNKLYNKSWVVYAKKPFGGPEQVIEYLARYSHKVAISNHRITAITEGKVSFRYKDYADGCQQKTNCKKGKMEEVLSFDNNGPPPWLINKLQSQTQQL